MRKKRIAFFDFTSCEGCQLQVANLGEVLLDVLDIVDVVMFREVMSEKTEDYDIAVVEGSITTPHDVERIKEIRKKAKVLIAFGSCAAIGGINGMKNNFDLDEIKKYVYGKNAGYFETIKTSALDQVVKVDYYVYGCPIYPPDFLKVLKHAIQDIPYTTKDVAVCAECKLNENECMYDKGIACLGPVTKGGCNSWCINSGNICYGCRGMVKEPVKNGCMEVLNKYNIPVEWITSKFNMYNKTLESEDKK
ncbi:MAG: cytochrome B [Bacillota bacterium]|nr:cytochrome B [Bacillota bacterium]